MRKKITYITMFIMTFLIGPGILLAKEEGAKSLICDEALRNLIIDYWGYVAMAAPILLIVMSTIEFLKAMSTGDSDAISKSSSNTVKRVIATAILFLIPTLIKVIFDLFGVGDAICF